MPPPPTLPLFLDQTEKFLGRPGAPLSKGLDDHPPLPPISRSGSSTGVHLVWSRLELHVGSLVGKEGKKFPSEG